MKEARKSWFESNDEALRSPGPSLLTVNAETTHLILDFGNDKGSTTYEDYDQKTLGFFRNDNENRVGYPAEEMTFHLDLPDGKSRELTGDTATMAQHGVVGKHRVRVEVGLSLNANYVYSYPTDEVFVCVCPSMLIVYFYQLFTFLTALSLVQMETSSCIRR